MDIKEKLLAAGPVVCEFDCTDPGWTRIKITDRNSVYMSEECDCDDEDDY